MKKILRNKAAGFYIEIVASLVTLFAVILYGSSLYKSVSVYVLLGLAIALFFLATGASVVLGDRTVLRSVTLVNAVLTALAVIQGAAPMVNQIGFVISGLDPIDTITGFLVFAGVSVFSILLHLAASFARYTK